MGLLEDGELLSDGGPGYGGDDMVRCTQEQGNEEQVTRVQKGIECLTGVV
jgi:hypothetical protein